MLSKVDSLKGIVEKLSGLLEDWTSRFMDLRHKLLDQNRLARSKYKGKVEKLRDENDTVTTGLRQKKEKSVVAARGAGEKRLLRSRKSSLAARLRQKVRA